MKTLEERREDLCLNFAIKCTKNSRLASMFPQNLRNHQMKTRNNERFKVQFVHTDRLQKSSIIYMQKLLNEHETRINEK